MNQASYIAEQMSRHLLFLGVKRKSCSKKSEKIYNITIDKLYKYDKISIGYKIEMKGSDFYR